MRETKKEKAAPAATEEAPPRRNRRQAIALAGAAAAGAAVAALGVDRAKKTHADPDDPLILGQDNDTGSLQTELQGDVDPGVVFRVEALGAGGAITAVNSGEGGAMGAHSVKGVGLHATSEESHAIYGLSRDLDGLHGDSEKAAGVYAESQTGEGAVGTSRGHAGRAGVLGLSFRPDAPPEAVIPDDLGEGTGVLGRSGSGPGVEGHSESGPGVKGGGLNGAGVLGITNFVPAGPGPSAAGIHGVSLLPVGGKPIGDAIGVAGASGGGTGVLGSSVVGAGVLGLAGADAPGVRALSAPCGASGLEPGAPDGGLALDVVGKARFSTAGVGVVPARADAATVSSPAVTSDSHITVTFTGDPGRASVAWVQRQPGSGFIVHLSGKSRWAVPFTYLIVEPGT